MTRPQLVIKNLSRNRRRTLFTVASVAASIFLFTILSATYSFILSSTGGSRANLLLIVTSRVSPRLVLVPASYRERIARVPGVEGVTPFVTFDAHYGGEDSFMVAWPSDPEVIFKVFTDWQLPEEQRRAYMREKVALVAGRKVAEKYGWKIGDHVPLRSADHNLTIDPVLRGLYTSKEGDESMLAFHWDYFRDARGGLDKGGVYWVVAKTPEDVPRVMKEIDSMFRNAEVETQTQTMMQFSLDFMAGLGNVKRILLSVSAAVVFMILLIVANSMAMSIRERTVELAVLRALGFRGSQLMGLLAAESLAISLTGAAAGCLGAWLLCKLIAGVRIAGWIPISIPLNLPVLGVILAVIVGISLLSTFLPAYHASRASIAQALRFVG
jgi:putative ABC transport system permease protein